MANNTTDWNINTDIYSILESIQEVQRRYIDDEDETTLSLGPFGFIADTEAKKIQTATIMAGQLGNEMFPNRAKLTKNVLAHATYNGITNINASPANIDATICIKMDDIIKYSIDGYFYLDCDCSIFIGEYEFHLDYDVKIRRQKVSQTSEKYAYSAMYITEDENGNKITNRLSNIINPYIAQPFTIKIGPLEYLAIQVTIRQYTLIEIYDTMTSNSIIENKSYAFEFENQLADFRIVVTDNGVETEIKPYMYGSTIDPDTPYCWYIFTSENSVRITFDSKSYIPGLNSDIYIRIYDTLGANGNFEYLGIDNTSEGLYTDIKSRKYNYASITSYLVALTDSVDGADRKSKEELQQLIPKAAMSRGSITTETDLNNYFNLINTDVNKIFMKKKEDNQLNRIWYAYFMLKDDNNNVIPTNSITVKISINNSANIVKTLDGRYIIPAGTYLKYDITNQYAYIVDEGSIPKEYSEEYFANDIYYYMTLYNIAISFPKKEENRPIAAGYYLCCTNHDSYFLYEYVNETTDLQFIANRFHFKRNILTDKSYYKLTFGLVQSIIDQAGYANPLNYSKRITRIGTDGNVVFDEESVENLLVVLVIYRDGKPYRWAQCVWDEEASHTTQGIYYFYLWIKTDDNMDGQNRIKINEMYEVGSNIGTIYGFMDGTSEARIYILARSEPDPMVEFPRMDLDEIAPGYDEYIVTNIYKCATGLDFFENYTDVTNTKIDPMIDGNDKIFKVSGVPVVGRHYAIDDENISQLTEAVKEKRAYIDNCLKLCENSLTVDFKFFNTYGFSRTFMLKVKNEQGDYDNVSIRNIDCTFRFKVSLKNVNDTDTKEDLIYAIKSYVENFNDLEDLHVSNLITTVTNDFSDRINFLEFVGFNSFNTGDQYIVSVEPEDPYVVPEFINVRNILNEETDRLEPAIELEVVTV